MTKATPETSGVRQLAEATAKNATIAVRSFAPFEIWNGPKIWFELNGEGYDELTYAIHSSPSREEGLLVAEEVFSQKFGRIIGRSIKECEDPESKRWLRRLQNQYRAGDLLLVNIHTDAQPEPEGLRPPRTITGIPLHLRKGQRTLAPAEKERINRAMDAWMRDRGYDEGFRKSIVEVDVDELARRLERDEDIDDLIDPVINPKE